MSDSQKEPLSVHIPAELYHALQRRAEDAGTTVSAYASEIVERYIQEFVASFLESDDELQ